VVNAAGFILIGGESRRMGRDKALLADDSGFILEHLAQEVAVAAGSVALIGRPDSAGRFGLDFIPDVRQGMGPLAGIEAALCSGRGALNLIVACDMPGVKREWLAALLHEAEEKHYECVLTQDRSGELHPLCAVYAEQCLPVVRAALDAGNLRVLDIVRHLRTGIAEYPGVFWNVNSPSEWLAWKQRGRAEHGS